MSAAVMQEGIVHAGHFKVSQRGAGANQSVDVAAGEAWVDGDSVADQGYYHVVNDATVNVPVAAANGSNPRIDAIVLNVVDSTEVGGSDEYKLESLSGTATAGATLANLKGAPAIGNTKLLLAYVLVPTSSTEVINARIGGLRDPRAGLTGYPAKAEPFAIEAAPPQYAHGRPLGYVPAVEATRSAALGLPNNTEKVIELTGTEGFDTDEMHNPGVNPSRLICKTPGFYTAGANWATVAAKFIFKVNGTAVRTSVSTESPEAICEGGVFRLGSGDYLELAILQGSGSEKSLTAAKFRAAWIGP